MYEEFFAKRIAQLRLAKNVSAREMSLSIGQNKNYIAQIESGKAYPSTPALLFICDYLGIHPKDFFDDSVESPAQLHELVDKLKKLTPNQMSHIMEVVNDLVKHQ